MKDEAYKRLKNINIKYASNEADSATYYVTGEITEGKLNAYWHNPSVTVSNKLIRTEESTWTDENNKSHKQDWLNISNRSFSLHRQCRNILYSYYNKACNKNRLCKQHR